MLVEATWNSLVRVRQLRDDLDHYREQSAAADKPSLEHLETEIEKQQATICRLESTIKDLQTTNSKAKAEVRDAKRTAAAQVAAVRSLVEETEAKFFAEQSVSADAEQQIGGPGRDLFTQKSEADAETEQVSGQLAAQRRNRQESNHKANESERERAKIQHELNRLRLRLGQERYMVEQERAETRARPTRNGEDNAYTRASLECMRQSADRRGEHTKADQECMHEPLEQINQQRDWLVRVLGFFNVMESWVVWFVDNPPTDLEASNTVMENQRQWTQLRTEIGADNLAKFLTSTKDTASPNGSFSLSPVGSWAGISQSRRNVTLGSRGLNSFSLSPLSFRNDSSRNIVNDPTALPQSRVASQEGTSQSREVSVTPPSTRA